MKNYFNGSQRVAFWFGLILFVFWGLFPPWEFTRNASYSQVEEGGITFEMEAENPGGASSRVFWFLLNRPNTTIIENRLPNSLTPVESAIVWSQGFSVDMERLLILWFLTALVTGSFIFALADERKPPELGTISDATEV